VDILPQSGLLALRGGTLRLAQCKLRDDGAIPSKQETLSPSVIC